MAIGIGQMLGFKFMENFNYPYISRSMTEFWRRWHISLSSWFRDYLFYPLERRGSTPQAFNILFVFLMTGLWHGLTLNFAVWGLLQGLAIALERGRFGGWLRSSLDSGPACLHPICAAGGLGLFPFSQSELCLGLPESHGWFIKRFRGLALFCFAPYTALHLAGIFFWRSCFQCR